MSISKLNDRLIASIAGYLQEPQHLESTSKRIRNIMTHIFYPRLFNACLQTSVLKRFIEGFSGIENLHHRMFIISRRVLEEVEGVHLGDAFLQSMHLSRTSLLYPPQIISLCNWHMRQQDRNLILFFQRVCDYCPTAKAFLTSVEGDTKAKAKQIRIWLKENQAAVQGIEWVNFRNLSLTQLSDEIRYFSGLKRLYLDGNMLFALPESLKSLQQLEMLSANGNYIADLPEALKELPCLSQLSFNYNCMPVIPPLVYTLSNLQVLYWEGNNLSELSPAICQMQELRELNLSCNALEKLPAEIGDLSNLSELYLNDNRLTCLPDELAKLPLLSRLTLDNNPIREVCQTLKESTNAAIQGNLTIKISKSKPSN